MKLKYAIIATIIFNLVLISIFLCRQYKEYHNRKHDYIRIIEASKAKIIKEIENTILKIIKDEKVRNERIQEGLDNIKKYDLKTIAKKYIEFYEKNIIGD